VKSCSHHPASIGKRTNLVKDDSESRHYFAFFLPDSSHGGDVQAFQLVQRTLAFIKIIKNKIKSLFLVIELMLDERISLYYLWPK
jgi:hypothetical protein